MITNRLTVGHSMMKVRQVVAHLEITHTISEQHKRNIQNEPNGAGPHNESCRWRVCVEILQSLGKYHDDGPPEVVTEKVSASSPKRWAEIMIAKN